MGDYVDLFIKVRFACSCSNSKSSQVKFILPTCKTKVGTSGKRRKTLRSSKSAAPSINNLSFTLSGISLEIKIIKRKKNRNAFATETKLHKHRITETRAQRKQSYINTIIIK